MNSVPLLPRFAKAVASLAVVVVVGCGDEAGNSADREAASATAEPTATEATTVAQVAMRDITFEPKNLLVLMGTTVRWTNYDQVIHTVTQARGPGGRRLDSDNVAPGMGYEFTFTRRGRYDYVCALHHGQVGSVVVQ